MFFISKVLPIIWLIPWIFVKEFTDNYWCWQVSYIFFIKLQINNLIILL